jgi:E3 ubiquitin-protein ligase HUWE1
MNVVGALCVDTSSAQQMKDISVDLTNVRKFVLETISRTIKDLPPTESTEARYGRLLALADICHQLLTVRMNLGSRKQQDEVPTHMAKIMLEKNFVTILTTALSEIDLNYPNVRNLVAAMLRPLEHLYVFFSFLLSIVSSNKFRTKIAIKMSRASGKTRKM